MPIKRVIFAVCVLVVPTVTMALGIYFTAHGGSFVACLVMMISLGASALWATRGLDGIR